MNIISYNVNGIRSAMSKGLIDWVDQVNPDIICFQELKATPDQFDAKVFEKMGYFCLWNSADRKGYSGVATLTKVQPLSFSLGINNSKFDQEGRVIRTDFKNFTHICVYVPSGSMGGERQVFKMSF